MDKCTEFCRQVLILVNGLAVVKSIDFIFVGAVLNVLQSMLIPSLSNVVITSADLSDHVTGAELYVNTWLFMLITGPVLLIVSLLGFFGAKTKNRLMLAFFIIIQVLLIITLIVLSVTRLPPPFVSPSREWQPLTNLVLAGIIIVCAIQGTLVLFSMVLISNLKDDRVEPSPRPNGFDNSSRRFADMRRHSLK